MSSCLDKACQDLKQYFCNLIPCSLCKSPSEEDERAAEVDQKKKRSIENRFRKIWPKPIDITVGLLKAEGHYITHLAYGLSIFLVKKADDK